MQASEIGVLRLTNQFLISTCDVLGKLGRIEAGAIVSLEETRSVTSKMISNTQTQNLSSSRVSLITGYMYIYLYVSSTDMFSIHIYKQM